MSVTIKQHQFPRVLRKLEKSFRHNPESVMEYGDKKVCNQAMARGILKKSGIQVPRFVISRKQDLEASRVFLNIRALSSRGLPNGDYHGFDYPESLNFEVVKKSEKVEGPLNRQGEVIDDGESYIYDAAVECGRLLLPAALEAKTLSLDNKVSSLLLPYV
jgi:hypothetical protein